MSTTMSQGVAGYPLWLWAVLGAMSFWCLIWLFWILASRRRSNYEPAQSVPPRSGHPGKL